MTTPRKTCTWRETEDGDWETECEHSHWLPNANTPAESEMAWCPYCGGRLREVEWVDDLEVTGEER